MFVFCWRREDVEGCGVVDLFDVICGVCIVIRWVAGGLYKNMGAAAALWCGMYSLHRMRYVCI